MATVTSSVSIRLENPGDVDIGQGSPGLISITLGGDFALSVIRFHWWSDDRALPARAERVAAIDALVDALQEARAWLLDDEPAELGEEG